MADAPTQSWQLPSDDLFASAAEREGKQGEAPSEPPDSGFGSVWSRATLRGGFEQTGLAVPIGTDDNGEPDLIDMSDDSVLLISGPPRSGKRALLRSLLAGVLMQWSPSQVRVLLIDTSDETYSDFAGIPQLLAPILADPREALAALGGVVAEVGRRYEFMASSGVRSIDRMTADDRPARIVVVIDDLLPLARTDQRALEQTAVHLAGRGRAAGVHVILATSSSTVPVLAAIASNITEEISFDSAFVSGSPIPELVLVNGQLPEGEFLWEPIAATYPVRRRPIHITDDEIRAVVDHWRRQGRPDYVL